MPYLIAAAFIAGFGSCAVLAALTIEHRCPYDCARQRLDDLERAARRNR